MLYRNTILTVLAHTRHMRAEDIFYKLKQQHAGVSITTIYRNIKSLEKRGVVVSLLHPDGSARYELKETLDHQHLICQDCGKVFEIKFGFLAQLSESLKERAQFEILEEHVAFVGTCIECKS